MVAAAYILVDIYRYFLSDTTNTDKKINCCQQCAVGKTKRSPEGLRCSWLGVGFRSLL